MLAPLATTLFAATLVVAVAALYLLVIEARARIAAALRGTSLLAAAPPLASVELRVSQRYPSPARRPLRARLERAAA